MSAHSVTQIEFVKETPFLSLIGATLTIHALSLGVPVLTLQVYDRVLPSENTNTLAVLLAGVAVAIVLETILRLIRSYMLLWLGTSYEHKMACRLMARIITSNPVALDKEAVGSMLHSLMSIGRLKEFHPAQLTVVATDLIFVGVFVGLIAWIAGELALVPIAIIIIFVLVSVPQGARLRKALKLQEHSDDDRFDFLIERLTKVHISKALALENNIARKYEELASSSSAANLNVVQSSASSINMIALFSHIMIGGIVAYGAQLVINGDITVGVLIASILLSGRSMQMTQRGVLQWVKYQDFAVAQEKIEEIGAVPVKIATGTADDSRHLGSLQLREVTIAESENTSKISIPSFQAEPGQVIAISGGQGKGRSTLLKTMAGIYQGANGDVELDGSPISEFSQKERARRIAYLGPDGAVFRGTIKDNITRFGEVPLGQALEIARLLNVDQEVSKLPGGYDTFLDDAVADNISTGLKQRIALVRSLAVKPRVILYDNADHGLDEVGFASICQLLIKLQGKATLILASDSPEIVKRATKNYHFEDGELRIGRGVWTEQFEEIRI